MKNQDTFMGKIQKNFATVINELLIFAAIGYIKNAINLANDENHEILSSIIIIHLR